MKLTREQMAIQYPDQWLGLKDPVYLNNDGIIGWYTTDNSLQLGMAEIV